MCIVHSTYRHYSLLLFLLYFNKLYTKTAALVNLPPGEIFPFASLKCTTSNINITI